MKKILILITVLLGALKGIAQPDCILSHYSSEDGLSQNTVMSILQDRKGVMWFSTWDGINKFDGYTFKSYKADKKNQLPLVNNRVDQMFEDKYGFLWLQSYADEVYRFDPRLEDFELVPAVHPDGRRAPVVSIKVLPGGSVWLLTRKSGAIRVQTSADNFRLTTTWYCDSPASGGEASVFDVMEDADGREWLLTDKGLCMIPVSGGKPVCYPDSHATLPADGHTSFRAALDCGTEILFGAGDGSVWAYQKPGGQFRKLPFSAAAGIVSIVKLDNRQVLLATDTNGFFVYDLANGTGTHYGAEHFPAAPIRSAQADSHREVWFEQEVAGTVVHFNARTRQLKTEVIAVEPTSTDRSRPAFHMHEDCKGRTWVHPYGGGFSYFDRESNSLRPFYNKLMSDNWRFSNKIHAAFSDRQGNLWLCTHSKGLEKATFRSSQFKMVTPAPHRYESLSNEVRALCEDRYHNLWVGLKDGKLRVYDSARRERGYLTEDGTVSTSGTPLRGNVYFILEDSKYNLWIATKGDGLVKAEPQGTRYKLTRYRYKKDDVYSLSDDNVYCVYEDASGRIWVATFAGGVNYLTTGEDGKPVFMNHRNRLNQYPIGQCNKVRYITGDSHGVIWIGTTMGALAVDGNFRRPEEAVFHHFVRGAADDTGGLSNNDVHWIIPTGRQELYFATFGGGLDKLVSWDRGDNAVFKVYDVDNGLPSDVLLSIREDRHGNLWMSTENGVSKFIPSSERFENYTDKSLPFAVRFSEAASACTSRGNVLFGCSNGIFVLNPDSIKKSAYTPPIVLSKLLVANKEVLPSDSSVLKVVLDRTEKLTLSHKENMITFQFAALDYSEPSEIQYAYMLEGFDKSWNYVGKQRSATYTNLPKGNYVFKVCSTNADGVWTDNTRSLSVEVLPSFWETPLAYFLYVLFILLVIVTAVYILFTIYRLKHRVYMEHQMTDMKLRFFTDISHELRTPLTLIAGPVEYVVEHTDLPADAREQLKVVERNTRRMLRLINQILDFRKIQNKKMKMQVQQIEVVEFTRRIMENFESLADEHQIEFSFKSDKDKYKLWVDADKYEKIVYNLISNAFKYTPNGKRIAVSVHETEKTVDVSVCDQGIGIAENRRKSIFLRFENMADRSFFNPSTGIGLSLVKELVDMHKATITVDSKLGEGSSFKVSFLKGKEHFDACAEFLQNDDSVAVATTEATGVQPPQDSEENLVDNAGENSTKSVMLIVEDNSELRLFLRSIFSADFKVVDAVDGVDGYEKALKYLPDMIISDVMMPRKDGIELTRDLRADMTTSHIPIVLLTAKTATESKLAGLDYGADDYITKPFSATYLKARVRNLLAQRQKLQELYRQKLANVAAEATESGKAEEKKETEMSPIDRKFMDKLMELMEKNMDNGELLVDDLVQELAVSRSVFFKKLKTLTGLAPVEFIKEIRINRAAQLIGEGQYSMTQISYMVGINDPRYFSKCFKHKFGMTPTEYREKVLNHR